MPSPRPRPESGLPVAFEATVTDDNRADVDLFVQEGGEAIYVEAKENLDLASGDRVLVRGKTRESLVSMCSATALQYSIMERLPSPC